VRWNNGYASISRFSTHAVLFVLEKTSLSSVIDSKLYILQYKGQGELRLLTLALESLRQVGLKEAYARAAQVDIYPAAEGVPRPQTSADMQ
jgi:hypothetical protein